MNIIMRIIQKRKIMTSLSFFVGTPLIAASIYLIESESGKAGAIVGILGGFALISGIYLHAWLELNAMADLKEYVDEQAERP